MLFCFNPTAVGADRVSLYPLGNELKLRRDPPIEGLLSDEKNRVVDGIVIYEKFVSLYDRMYGARYVGRPLTKMRINNGSQRYEQFFENMGFFQNLDEPNGPVHLISYGAYFCGQGCSYNLEQLYNIINSNMIDQPFAESIARLGGTAVFGEPLLQPRLAPDGYIEQVYTNGIFFGLPNDPSVVQMRPITRYLDIIGAELVQKKSHNKLVFYEIRPGLGHNVPTEFDEFIALHGGKELSGEPISEVVRLGDQNLYRQCFENYCLIYDPAASNSLKVRLMPLGQEYNKKFPPDESLALKEFFTPETVLLSTSAENPNLSMGEEQVIHIVVQWKANQTPLDRVEGNLVVTYPDGTVARYFFPSTDAQGRSTVVLPARSGLKHGERVTYQVCLNLPSKRLICDMQSYLIWNVK